MHYIKQLVVILCIFLFSTQSAIYSEEIPQINRILNAKTIKEIEMSIEAKRYDHLGMVLREFTNKTITFKEIKEIAIRKKSVPLLRAIQAAEIVYAKKNKLGLRLGGFLQIGIFMETKMSRYIEKGKYFLTPRETNLTRTIEYDPKTKFRFILLSGKHGSFLGEGKKKTVIKAIRYDRKNPEILARGEQCKKLKLELEITKLLKGKPGVYNAVAFTSHEVKGKQYVTIYSKLYSPGSFATIFESNIILSAKEKSKVVLDILAGLESLHQNNIVHTDLSPKNYLVNISPGTEGRRKITATISDFGRSKFASESRDISVQGNSLYVAPEGVFREKLMGSDYFATDIYAAGCVFYRLFYERAPPWQEEKYIKNRARSKEENYAILIEKINKATEARRDALATKNATGILPAEEALEYLILCMVNPDPRKRGTAKELKRNAATIFKRL